MFFCILTYFTSTLSYLTCRYNQPNSANHDYSLCCPGNLPITIADGLPHTCKLLIQNNNKLTLILDDKYLFLKDFVVDFQRVFGNGKKFKISFTGATGGLSEEHTILAWTVSFKSQKANGEQISTNLPPLESYILFEEGNLTGIEKKFREFCALESTSISEQQIQSLLNMSSWKMVDCSLIVNIIKQWKFDHLFPVIDLLRLAVVSNKWVAQTFSKLFIQNQKDHLLLNVLDRLKEANETNSSYSYCLLTLRLLNNMFTEKLSRVYVNKFSETILDQLCENKHFSAHLQNKAYIRNVWITTFFNLSLLFTKEFPSEEMTVRLFNIVFEFLENECKREDTDESCCVMALNAMVVLLKITSKEDSLNEDSMLHGLALSMDLVTLLSRQLATKFCDTQQHAPLHALIHSIIRHLDL